MMDMMLVVIVLLIGAILASVMQENVSGNTRFSLSMLGPLLVVIVGGGLHLLWGWKASLGVLAAFWAWALLCGLVNRAQARAMSKPGTPKEGICPQCGEELRSRVSGGSVVAECASGCGWNVALTNPRDPSFDPQLYDVFAPIAGQDKKRAVAKLAVALGLASRDVIQSVERNEPIAKSVQALEVQRIARLLDAKGIAVAVRPDFPWPLTLDRPNENTVSKEEPLTFFEKFLVTFIGFLMLFFVFAHLFAGPPLDVVATAPSTVVMGQTFTLSLKVSNLRDTALELNMIEATSSVGRAFQVKATSPRLFGIRFLGEPTWNIKHVLEPGSSTIIEFAVKPLRSGRERLDFRVCHDPNVSSWNWTAWNWGYWDWSDSRVETWNCTRIVWFIEVAPP